MARTARGEVISCGFLKHPAIRPADNPFSTARMEKVLVFRPEWSGVDASMLLEKVRTAGPPVAVIGAHGSGKTTLLDWLARELQKHGETVRRVFLNDLHTPDHFLTPAPEPPAAGSIVLVDGEDLASWKQRRRLRAWWSPAKRVVLARHRRGRHAVAARLSASPALLRRCARTLAPDLADRIDGHLDEWFRMENGNMRHCLLRCYDWVAENGP